jgi:OFA family oxalate/formate antiporter-like MFS transporter
MLRTWQFWLLYAMFVATAGADLIVISNVVTFADQLGFTYGVATVAATVLPVAAGASRLLLGEATDRLGRKPVMGTSFLLAGLCRVGLVGAGRLDSATAFVALVVLAMFFSSPLYVYFPSLLSDYYGSAYSAGNYAVLYTAKVGGGVIAGALAGSLAATYGWGPTFLVGAALALAAGLAVLALRPPADSGLADASAPD